jgi:hypothetical protein
MSECAVEDPTIVVRLTWDGGGLLELPPGREDAAGLWWQTLLPPPFAMRETTAPVSAWVPGDVLLGSVPASSVLAVTVAALGTDGASLEVQRGLLAAAVAHFHYTASIIQDPDGTPLVLGSWPARPTIPVWSAITPQRAGLHVAEAVLAIPVNPVGAP